MAKELQYVWVDYMTYLALLMSLAFGMTIENLLLKVVLLILGGLSMGRLFVKSKEVTKVYNTIISLGYLLGFIIAAMFTIEVGILNYVILSYLILYPSSIYFSYWLHKNKIITSVEY